MTQLVLTAANWLNIQGLIELFNEWGRKRARKAMIRQTRRELSQLTDYELRDLGIGRSDIESIARGTFHDDRIKTATNNNLRGWV